MIAPFFHWWHCNYMPWFQGWSIDIIHVYQTEIRNSPQAYHILRPQYFIGKKAHSDFIYVIHLKNQRYQNETFQIQLQKHFYMIFPFRVNESDVSKSDMSRPTQPLVNRWDFRKCMFAICLNFTTSIFLIIKSFHNLLSSNSFYDKNEINFIWYKSLRTFRWDRYIFWVVNTPKELFITVTYIEYVWIWLK